jgi:hypothetical protein
MARKSPKSPKSPVVRPPAMSALEAEMSMLEDDRYADTGIDLVGMQYA